MAARHSFEFFPPRSDEAWASFEHTASELAALAPEYVSVTFGAGGSVQGAGIVQEALG